MTDTTQKVMVLIGAPFMVTTRFFDHKIVDKLYIPTIEAAVRSIHEVAEGEHVAGITSSVRMLKEGPYHMVIDLESTESNIRSVYHFETIKRQVRNMDNRINRVAILI